MGRRGKAGIATGLALAVGIAGASTSCNGSNAALAVAENCSINSDCRAPLVCAFSRCHSACEQQRDCPAGQRCVASTAGGVCQLPTESTCGAVSLCQAGQACGSDGQCRATCSTTGGPCAAGDFCVVSGSTSACYASSNSADQTTLVAIGAISPDGSVLDDASTIVLDAGPQDTGPGADVGQGTDAGSSEDSTVGGDAGDGAPAEGCDATLLANGTCDYCPVHACTNGTCLSGDHDYSCQCNAGYTGTGSKTCTLFNGCVGSNRCPPSNPCVSIASAGTACLGQYAAWPTPDPGAAGSGTTVLPSYSNNGDGTISDNVTGLMWQLDVPTNGCTGPDAASAECTVADAEAYCAGLALAGYNDWRLPYRTELDTLLDCVAPQPPHIAGPFQPMPGAIFWTDTAIESAPSSNWYVNFDSCDLESTNGATASYGVRCVRGTGIPPTTPRGHYSIQPGAIDAGSGDAAITGDTVTDDWTGLVWERNVPGTGTDFSTAAAHCAALGQGFRLPTLQELLTLLDPLGYSPAIDTTAFPGTPFGTAFWSSSIKYPPSTSGTAFTVEFANGNVSTSPTYGCCPSNYVRCVH